MIMELVQISELQLIETSEEFFHTSKILAVDVLPVGSSPKRVREHVKDNLGGFVYNQQTYLLIRLKGRPGDLMLQLEKGFTVNLPYGTRIAVFVEASLERLIQHKKIYRFDRGGTAGEVAFVEEVDFLVDRYILNKA